MQLKAISPHNWQTRQRKEDRSDAQEAEKRKGAAKARERRRKAGFLFEVCARRVMCRGAQGKQVKCCSAQTDDSSTLVAG